MDFSAIAGRPGPSGAENTSQAKPADRTPVNSETFLQLLVAQIKNQNPLNPADGVQFLSQLAQFSELEQTMGIRQAITELSDKLTAAASAENQTQETGA